MTVFYLDRSSVLRAMFTWIRTSYEEGGETRKNTVAVP